MFCACPVTEILYAGGKGSGKTTAFFFRIAPLIGKGYGSHLRVLILRRRYKGLESLRANFEALIQAVFPGTVYNVHKMFWKFSGGEEIHLGHAYNRAAWMDKYHGHEYPRIYIDEIVNWPDDDVYNNAKFANRVSMDIPKEIVSGCNPFGPGHAWVKAYWPDLMPENKVYQPPPVIVRGLRVDARARVWFRGLIEENEGIMNNDPSYMADLAADSNAARRAAWLDCDWNIASGQLFGEVWNQGTEELLYIQPFKIPSTWYCYRSFDYGFGGPNGAPSSCGFWAVCDADVSVPTPTGRKQVTRGSVFRIAELYWCDEANDKPHKGRNPAISDKQMAQEIRAMESHLRQQYGAIIMPGPCDPKCFSSKPDDTDTAARFRSYGVEWVKGSSPPGSRAMGFKAMLDMMHETIVGGGDSPEGPCFYAFNTCGHFRREVTTAMRDDLKAFDTEPKACDHALDETRYLLFFVAATIGIALRAVET